MTQIETPNRDWAALPMKRVKILEIKNFMDNFLTIRAIGSRKSFIAYGFALVFLGIDMVPHHNGLVAPAYGNQNQKKSKTAATPAPGRVDPAMNRGLAQIIALAENGQLRPFDGAKLSDTVRRALPDMALIDTQTLTPYWQWLYLTNKKSLPKISEIEQFLAEHPNWPQQDVLRERAESTMAVNESDADFLLYASIHPPVTKGGTYRLIRALLASGKNDAAAQIASKFYITADFTATEERGFLQSFRPLLTQTDIDQRMEYLLWHEDHRAATRDLMLVSPLSREIAKIRLQLQMKKPNIDKIMASLPNAAYSEGLNFDRINWYPAQRRAAPSPTNFCQFNPAAAKFGGTLVGGALCHGAFGVKGWAI